VRRHGRTLIPLTARPGGPRAYKMLLPSAEPEAEQKSHDGYEWMYVLSGRVRLRLAEHDFVMKVGEAAEFDTRTRTGSAAPDRNLPSCSSCSGPRASACTSAPAPAPVGNLRNQRLARRRKRPAVTTWLHRGHRRARLAAMASSSDRNPEDEYADDEYADHDAEDREQPSVPSEIPDDEPEDDVLEQRQEVPYRDDGR
jgi:Cupin domain